MPVTPPPAVIAPALPDDHKLPSGMMERERQVWLVPLRSTPRATEPCPDAKDSEIVVCARREDDPARDRLGAPVPEPAPLAQRIGEKLHAQVGPVELGSIDKGDGTRAFGMRVRF